MYILMAVVVNVQQEFKIYTISVFTYFLTYEFTGSFDTQLKFPI